MEALRFEPVVPIILLQAREAVALRDVAVPAGTPDFALTRPAATDERHYGDAGRFRPGRWAGKPHDGPWRPPGHRPARTAAPSCSLAPALACAQGATWPGWRCGWC